MAAGSGSLWSRSHTVRVAYWKVSMALAGAPQPGRAHNRGRNITRTVSVDHPRGGGWPPRIGARVRYGVRRAYHGRQ